MGDGEEIRIVTKLILSKIDVAERQVTQAIRLYFAEGDPVAIHTLASAAHTVARDLLDQREPEKMASFVKDTPVIRPDRKKEWINEVNKYPNYFKHADRDGLNSLEFETDLNPSLILDAVQMVGRLRGEWFAEGLVYWGWYIKKFPEQIASEFHSKLAELGPKFEVDPDDFEKVSALLNSVKEMFEARRRKSLNP